MFFDGPLSAAEQQLSLPSGEATEEGDQSATAGALTLGPQSGYKKSSDMKPGRMSEIKLFCIKTSKNMAACARIERKIASTRAWAKSSAVSRRVLHRSARFAPSNWQLRHEHIEDAWLMAGLSDQLAFYGNLALLFGSRKRGCIEIKKVGVV